MPKSLIVKVPLEPSPTYSQVPAVVYWVRPEILSPPCSLSVPLLVNVEPEERVRLLPLRENIPLLMVKGMFVATVIAEEALNTAPL